MSNPLDFSGKRNRVDDAAQVPASYGQLGPRAGAGRSGS